jgi:hypothetical protein
MSEATDRKKAQRLQSDIPLQYNYLQQLVNKIPDKRSKAFTSILSPSSDIKEHPRRIQELINQSSEKGKKERK